MSTPTNPSAIAVYCASSLGNQKAYQLAAISLGCALATAERPLVYGGGSRGIMGIVSGAVLEHGGHVTGVVPFAMVAAGGEGDKADETTKTPAVAYLLNEKGREKTETIIVKSMHDRKIEMAKRVGGFIGLPGGFGTYEEILEVICWTQIGLHTKPVVILNVLNFYDPLRAQIQLGIKEGFIQPHNEHLVVFVDGPSDVNEHDTFDWGKAAIDALDGWDGGRVQCKHFDWQKEQEIPAGWIRTSFGAFVSGMFGF
ncbi:hypothetical protein PILCRDRAFT_815024 [Piloderma croceum F 1598]|uniref:Cytokinin riboside 5'-monophosphate phosphoribohydrolase n=1 Tax=Piloderma croceum (strain F 1598) TaxID=765440 RepID=A0A0C3FTD0_PILCF|nr:hypothetical protein PILCRDRAFT_815024 [Piloderma croceum F 1598]